LGLDGKGKHWPHHHLLSSPRPEVSRGRGEIKNRSLYLIPGKAAAVVPFKIASMDLDLRKLSIFIAAKVVASSIYAKHFQILFPICVIRSLNGY
jgi:hypothetical protein